MDKKRSLSQETKTAINRKRKILAVQKVFHCTHCRLKCEKCGSQIDVEGKTEGQESQLRVPYKFCTSCAEEYMDYIERLKGEGDTECYWRNEPWRESWQRWIEYKGAIDRYTRSKEFAKLLNELKETTP